MKTEQVRNQAFKDIIDSLSARRKECYNIIVKYDKQTALQTSKKLKLPINSVVGRLNELSTMRLIKVAGTIDNRYTKTKNCVWTTTTEDERIELLKEDKIYYNKTIKALKLDISQTIFNYSKRLLYNEIRKLENKLKLIKNG